jgi:two-component system phosphate regulon sensor histidine kinase PhoR
MRRDFTDNVSHELKTPLTVITGYLETLMDQKKLVDPKLHKAIDQMHGQGERMKSLINDIISLSKLESIALTIDEAPINMRDMAEILRDEALQLSGEKRVIDLSIDDDWLITGSRSEVFSALSNLVFNAVKYTPDDAKITLSWQKTNLGGSFSVRDTGPGIAQEHLSRLTERFYRVDSSRTSATGGTGLGLAIAKHIMQRHGGDITVSSILGVGSNFICHFPNARLMNSVDQIKK